MEWTGNPCNSIYVSEVKEDVPREWWSGLFLLLQQLFTFQLRLCARVSVCFVFLFRGVLTVDLSLVTFPRELRRPREKTVVGILDL